jgi:predicted nucleic acid-binding Zn ribbon protein
VSDSPDQPVTRSENAAMDLVRRTLEEARNTARAQGKNVGQGRHSAGTTRVAGRQRGGRRAWSGPGPDARDPQLLGAASREVAAIRGWSERVAEGGVFGRWRAVVGDQIADHASPAALHDGVLSVTAESTAWATQLRMMQPQLLAKIAAAVGDGVVTSLKITGPAAPSWRKGPRRVAGRGPRDTYG